MHPMIQPRELALAEGFFFMRQYKCCGAPLSKGLFNILTVLPARIHVDLFTVFKSYDTSLLCLGWVGDCP